MDKRISSTSVENYRRSYWKFISEGLSKHEFIDVRAIKKEGGCVSRKYVQTENAFLTFCDAWNGKAHVYAGINPRIENGILFRLFVLDIDKPQEGDYERARQLKPAAFITSGNGYHLYFHLPSGVLDDRNACKNRNTVAIQKLQKHIQGKADVACSDPERVMRVPGTINLKNNNVAKILHIGEQNKKFFDWYSKLKVPKQETNKGGNEYGWIAKALQEMQMGNIDNTLFKICSRLRYDGYSREDAIVLLKPYADKAGATEGHLEEKIQNVWGRYESKGERRMISPIKQYSGSNNSSNIRFTSTEIFESIQETKWIVDKLVPEQSLAFIVGDPKAKKSWFALESALCTALGSPVGGRFETKKCKVLYLQLEDGVPNVGLRFQKLVRGYGKKPEAEYFTTYIGSGLKFDNESSWLELIEICNKIQPGLIVVDTLAKVHQKEENNASEMTRIVDKLCYLRDEFKTSVLVVHHLTKPFREGNKVRRKMRGSGVIEAAAESIMTVENDGEQQHVSVVTKANEEMGFTYRLIDNFIGGQPVVKLIA